MVFPAEYGVSGVKTFLVNHQGVVYQKDLGLATTSTARPGSRGELMTPDERINAGARAIDIPNARCLGAVLPASG